MSVDAFKIQKSLVINPRGAQPTSPEPGEQIYNSVTNTMQYYNGLIWIDVVNSSGTGGVAQNLITDGDAQSGVTNYIEGSYTAATRPAGTFTASSGAGLFTISTTTVTPINGTTSFLLTKSAGASRQGRAVERTIVLDREYQTKVLQMRVKFNTVSGTFVAGSATTDSSAIFYIGQFNGTTWTYTEPSTFKTLSASSIVDYVSGSFQVNIDTTQIKLISYVAETVSSAWVLACEFEISPSVYVYGSPVTDWSDYTPIVTSNTGTLTNFTLLNTQSAKVGQNLYMKGTLRFTGAPGTWSFPNISFPSGLASINDGGMIAGRVSFLDAGTNAYGGAASLFGTTGIQIISPTGTNGAQITVSQASPIVFGVNDEISWNVGPIKMAGLSSSTQMSDGFDGRSVVFSGAVSSQALTGNVTLLQAAAIRKDDVASYSAGVLTVKTSGDYTLTLLGTFSASPIALYYTINNGAGIYFVSMLSGASNATSGSALIPNLKAGDTVRILSSANMTISGVEYSFYKLQAPTTISASELCKSTITQTSGQGIPTSVNTKLQGIVVRDTHGMWSTVTNEWTQPRAGAGSISGCFHISIDGTSTGITTELYKDGVSVNSRYLIAPGIAYSYPLEYTWATNGVAGTKWSLYVFQGTGFTRPVLSASASNQITFKLD